MTDETAIRVVKFSDQILRPLSIRYQDAENLTLLDTHVLQSFWIFDMIYSASFDQDIHFVETDLPDQSTNLLSCLTQNQLSFDIDLGILFKFLMSILARLLRLSFR